jgi:2-oxoisovalerate dehydrogenase E1 component alpha subunit
MNFLRPLRRYFSSLPPYKKHCIPYTEDPSSFISSCEFKQPDPKITPSFRLIDLQGNYLGNPDWLPKFGEIMPKIYEIMVKTEQVDQILYMAQRQGRLSFYMPSFGETATTVATTAAVDNKDLMFLQYREQGAMLWRGMTIKNMTDQCCGNHFDGGKGRQMPVHYCVGRDLNFFSISSPLSKLHIVI